MKIAYFDLISGASGDMILGALVDAGLPFAELRDALGLLGLPEFELTAGPRDARRVFGHQDRRAHGRHGRTPAAWPRSSRSSRRAACPADIQARALRVFQRMAEAEAGIHGVPVETIHFHELGAVDTIVDVTGALLGLAGWGSAAWSPRRCRWAAGWRAARMASCRCPRRPRSRCCAAPSRRGGSRGGDRHAHRGRAAGRAGRGLRPASRAMRLTAVGYGAGTRTTPEPNVLRVLLGEADGGRAGTGNAGHAGDQHG